MKSKIKNLLALAVSGLMLSSCSVFAMRSGRPAAGYRTMIVSFSMVSPSTGRLTVYAYPRAFEWTGLFDDFINTLNSMNEEVIPVKLPDANELPSGMTLENCQACIRMRCPRKTINFV